MRRLTSDHARCQQKRGGFKKLLAKEIQYAGGIVGILLLIMCKNLFERDGL